MRFAGELARSFLALLLGGNLVLIYLKWTMPVVPPEITGLQSIITPCLFILLVATSLLQRKSEDAAPRDREVSPAASGMIVVLLTGAAAAIVLGWGATTASDLALPIGVAGATLVIAFIVFRYASRNTHRIGEARLSSPPAPPDP
jgi:hypothetical protein